MKLRITLGLTLLLYLSAATYLHDARVKNTDLRQHVEKEMAHKDSLYVGNLLCQEDLGIGKVKS